MLVSHSQLTRRLSSLIILSALIYVNLSCNQNKNKNFASIKGQVATSYKSKMSDYSWHFTRLIQQHLVQTRDIDNNIHDLSAIQVTQDSVIALSYKNAKLVVFDTTFRQLMSFGEKGSQDKKANSGIQSFDIQNQDLVLYDFGSKALKRYDLKKDSLVYYHPLKNPAGVYRVGYLQSDKFIYAKPDDSLHDLQFSFLDLNNTSVDPGFSAKKILGKEVSFKYPSLSLDGDFVTAKNSRHVVYYCSFTGLFLCFDKNAQTFLYSATTIDKTPIPAAAYMPISPIHKSLQLIPNILFFPSACVDEEKLYLLNNISTDNNYVIDIYDLNNRGKYLESMFIPYADGDSRPRSISCVGNTAYILYANNSIVKYAISRS